MSPDPGNVGATPDAPQSWNAYSYVLNNPLTFVDPSGLSCNDDNGNVILDEQGKEVFTTQSDCEKAGHQWINPAPTETVSVTATPLSTPSPVFYRLDDMYTSIFYRMRWVGSFSTAFVQNWFTVGMSFEPGSCTAVFVKSAEDSVKKLESLGTNTMKYGSAISTGLAGVGPQTQDVVDAMAAGGQLSPAAAFVATNVAAGTLSLATEAAPYVVKVAGYGVAGGMDYVFGKALNDEWNAIKKGQCKP